MQGGRNEHVFDRAHKRRSLWDGKYHSRGRKRGGSEPALFQTSRRWTSGSPLVRWARRSAVALLSVFAAMAVSLAAIGLFA